MKPFTFFVFRGWISIQSFQLWFLILLQCQVIFYLFVFPHYKLELDEIVNKCFRTFNFVQSQPVYPFLFLIKHTLSHCHLYSVTKQKTSQRSHCDTKVKTWILIGPFVAHEAEVTTQVDLPGERAHMSAPPTSTASPTTEFVPLRAPSSSSSCGAGASPCTKPRQSRTSPAPWGSIPNGQPISTCRAEHKKNKNKWVLEQCGEWALLTWNLGASPEFMFQNKHFASQSGLRLNHKHEYSLTVYLPHFSMAAIVNSCIKFNWLR